MELENLKDQNKNEIAMIEVAHAILDKSEKEMSFSDLATEVQNYLGQKKDEFKHRLPQFYTDLNSDGSFISLGGNMWGLRTWYPFNSIDEALVRSETDESAKNDSKQQKFAAFLSEEAAEDDVINYSDDLDDEFDGLKKPTKEVLSDGLEGQLTEVDEPES